MVARTVTSGRFGQQYRLSYRTDLIQSRGVRLQVEGVAAGDGPEIAVLPEIAQAALLRQIESSPGDVDVDRLVVAYVKQGYVFGGGVRRVGDPDDAVAAFRECRSVGAVLIDGQHFVIRDQRFGEIVIP